MSKLSKHFSIFGLAFFLAAILNLLLFMAGMLTVPNAIEKYVFVKISFTTTIDLNLYWAIGRQALFTFFFINLLYFQKNK